MNKIRDIVYRYDIGKLPKTVLQEICVEMNVAKNGLSSDLAERIWGELSKNRGSLKTLSFVENRLLVGQTSLTWLLAEGKSGLNGLKEKLINGEFNPFLETKTAVASDASIEPMLIGAAEGKMPNEYYLRYLLKVGNRQYSDGTVQRTLPDTDIITVYINEEINLIELRGNSKRSIKVLTCLTSLLDQDINLQQIKVLEAYKSNAENIAKKLDGILIEATSKPDFFLEDLSVDQLDSIIKIQGALNSFFDDSSDEDIIEILQHEKERFSESMLTTIPFTALMLCGMDTVGLKTKESGDLQKQPLYDYLNPHMTHKGGFIKFTQKVDGLPQQFTIRVGSTTESIYFKTPATEDIINFVRLKLLSPVLKKTI